MKKIEDWLGMVANPDAAYEISQKKSKIRAAKMWNTQIRAGQGRAKPPGLTWNESVGLAQLQAEHMEGAPQRDMRGKPIKKKSPR